MSAPEREALLRLRAAYFALFFGVSTTFAFAPLYYERLGFTAVQVGALVAIGPLIGFVAQPFWGHMSDRRQRPLAIVRANLLVAAGVAVLIPFLGNFWLLGAGIALLLFFQGPVNAILNGVTLTALGTRTSGFGRIRLFGSIGFTTGVVLTGLLLQARGTHNLFYVYAVAMAAVAVVLWLVRDRPAEVGARVRVSPLVLLRHSALVGLFLYAFLNEASHAGANAFLSIYIDRLGGTEAHVGAAHMVGSMACMPFFYFSQNLVDRFGPKALLIAGTCAYTLRWLLTPLATEPSTVLAVQLLHGPGFALTYTAAVSLVYRLTPPELRSSGQTTLALVMGGLGGMLGSMGAGFVVDAWGLRPLFYLCALVAGAAVVASPLLLREIRPEARANAA